MLKIVLNFVKKVQERCVGQEVMSSLTPGQHVIKIVNEEYNPKILLNSIKSMASNAIGEKHAEHLLWTRIHRQRKVHI